MISYAFIVVSILLATLPPAYIALYLVPRLTTIQTRYLAAAGLGLTFWFFYDTMGDAGSGLYKDESIVSFGGTAHVAVILLAAVGIAVLALFDHYAIPSPNQEKTRIGSGVVMSPSSLSNIAKSEAVSAFKPSEMKPSSSSEERAERSNEGRFFVLIPIAVASVMGIHGLAEGWDSSSVAALAPTTSLVATFGNIYVLASYPIHKLLEACIIASVYACAVGRNDSAQKRAWHIPVLGLLFGFTSVIGAAIGYFVAFDTTYFYAFGVTAAFYAALRLAEAVARNDDLGQSRPSYFGSKIFLAFGIGFFLLYSAALLH
jgi:hypothetical protein